jgi:coatomer subunit beta'
MYSFARCKYSQPCMNAHKLPGFAGCNTEQIVCPLRCQDCFIYNNAAWRLNYCVGSEVTTLYHLDKPMYLLGYLAAQSRVYLIDR